MVDELFVSESQVTQFEFWHQQLYIEHLSNVNLFKHENKEKEAGNCSFL